MTDKASFPDMGLCKPLLDNLQQLEFTVPTPIQQAAIPDILQGKDLIGQAQTGTGKTAAFLLPALHKLKEKPQKGVQLLILTPTRELTQQVEKEFMTFSKGMGLRSALIFGGTSAAKQIQRLKEGVQAIVATPGRLLDLLRGKKIPGFTPSIVVLDEADEMLDMGFLEDIQKIFEYLPEKRQTLLFSATLSQAIKKLAKDILKNPTSVNTSKDDNSKANITQRYYLLQDSQRQRALLRLIDYYQPEKGIIFCRTKREVDTLFASLLKKNFSVQALHGDMEQSKRQASTESFRKGDSQYLIATDIAGRGLNILDITHVFNYHMPLSQESYTHRIGRTGRAGQKGIAITLVTPQEMRRRAFVLQRNKKALEFCKMPSVKQVQEKKLKGFLDKVMQQSPHEGASSLLASLKKERKLEELALSLLSLPELDLFCYGEKDDFYPPESPLKPERQKKRQRSRALHGKVRKKVKKKGKPPFARS